MPAQKITRHANLFYLYIFENGFEKAREKSEMGSFFDSCWITENDLLKVVKFKEICRKR